MATFDSQRAAKEYLVGRIVAEAEREGKPLSEIERKMLYFSETDWSLPDIMEVNAEFERICDEGEYEWKICRIVRAVETQLESGDIEERDTWSAAIQKLSEGDHYLSLLVDPTYEPKPVTPVRPPGDILKLWLAGAAIALALFAGFILYERFFGSR